MNENEMMTELEKLKEEVTHGFLNIYEYIKDQEYSIIGCIDHRIYKLENAVNERLVNTEKDYLKREAV